MTGQASDEEEVTLKMDSNKCDQNTKTHICAFHWRAHPYTKLIRCSRKSNLSTEVASDWFVLQCNHCLGSLDVLFGPDRAKMTDSHIGLVIFNNSVHFQPVLICTNIGLTHLNTQFFPRTITRENISTDNIVHNLCSNPTWLPKSFNVLIWRMC